MRDGRFRRAPSAYERPRGARGILPLIAAAIAAGGVRAGVGLLQGASETRRKRGQINDAYVRGQARMNIHQQDVRQGEAESLGQRGLSQGGDVQIGSAVAPESTAEFSGYDASGNRMERSAWDAQQQAAKASAMSVSGAHTLAGQQQADLHREQGLEQNDLQAQRNNALSDVNAEGTQNAIGSIASGIQTGFQVAGMGSGGGATPSIASAYSQAGQDPYFGGIHPVNPDMSSEWGGGLARPGTTNAGFTKYGMN